jgi:hypothetical protein
MQSADAYERAFVKNLEARLRVQESLHLRTLGPQCYEQLLHVKVNDLMLVTKNDIRRCF